MNYCVCELPNGDSIAYDFAPENVKEKLKQYEKECSYDLGEMLELYSVEIDDNTPDPSHELVLAIEEQDIPSYEWVLKNL